MSRVLRDAARATAHAARAPVVGAGRVLSPAQNHVRSLTQELTARSHTHTQTSTTTRIVPV